MDHGNAARECLARRISGDRRVEDNDTAFVCRIIAPDDLADARLSRPIFTHQRVNLACVEIDMDIVEDTRSTKTLGDALEANGKFAVSHVFSLSGRVDNWRVVLTAPSGSNPISPATRP